MTALALDAVTKKFPRAGTVLDGIDLNVRSGEFFSLLGPSGCGKSTALRIIAGFETATSGRVLFDSRDVTDMPPNRRRIGFVFQSYALFPHLSVAENVAFGLEARKVPRAERSTRTAAALEDVQLPELGGARVDQLSGGQQQRVALARALVVRPDLLLLDEPLSNLDAPLRAATRAALRALHGASRITTVHVTHDQSEAMGMSDRVAVLRDGRIHQVGTPEEIYHQPATRFVADFIGRNNVLDARVIRVSDESTVVAFHDGAELTVGTHRRAPGVALGPGSPVGVCIRAESFRLASQGLFTGAVTDVEYVGALSSCVVETGIGNLQIDIPGASGRPAVGERVHVAATESAAYLVHARH